MLASDSELQKHMEVLSLSPPLSSDSDSDKKEITVNKKSELMHTSVCCKTSNKDKLGKTNNRDKFSVSKLCLLMLLLLFISLFGVGNMLKGKQLRQENGI